MPKKRKGSNRVHWTEDKYREYMRKFNGDRDADSAPDVEQVACDEPLGEEKGARYDSPVRIHVHSIRSRLADSDGVSGKAAIDGLVHAGILKDDSPKYVTQVSSSQEKAAGRPEKTIITITPIHP